MPTTTLSVPSPVRCKLRDGFSRLRRRHRGLRAGIGLTTATVFTGYVGGPHRHEFTAMGDGVNLAARLAAQAPARDRAG